ncbi:MAG: carbon-nitrogen hydrolase family protein [Burkholderiales bacterium]
MKVAAIQMVGTQSVERNLEQARALLEQAAKGGAELAALPEFFCLMAKDNDAKRAIGEDFGDGPIQRFLSDCARELGLWIVGGTLPLRTPDGGGNRVRSASLVFDPAGDFVARYDKMHLFRFEQGEEKHDETRLLEAGTEPVTFDLPSRGGRLWRVGLSVCYDLRFPEFYRALGADLLLVPSAFTWPTGQAHWELLLRARAVENLAYVLAPAQGGLHENGRRTWGHSMLVDPWGEVLAQHASGPAVVAGRVDAARLDSLRTQLPALSHRVL